MAPPWKIALADLAFGPEEEAAALRVLRSRWLTMGPEVRAFEEEFAAALGVEHAIAVSSGTAALHLSLLALGIGPGDEVIQPAVNFVAAANATVRVGARPVFADIASLENPTLDPADLARCLSPRARAVIVMHCGGAPCAMDAIGEFCRAHRLAVIEDACHGVGGSLRGRPMGTLGDIAAFSFFSNKNLATGEGGMVTTARADLAARVRALRSHGMTAPTWDRHLGHAAGYDVTCHGFNFRLDEMRAAIGREQLKKLAGHNARRRRLAREYHRRFAASGLRARGWLMPPLGVESDEAAHHLMVVVAPDAETRDAAAEHLAQRGIQTSRHYPFIPEFSAFAAAGEVCSPSDALSRSRAFCARVLTLPLHPLMDEAQVGEVVDALASCPSAR